MPDDDADLGGRYPWMAARTDGDILTADQLVEMQRWSAVMWERAFGDLGDLGDRSAMTLAIDAREAFRAELLRRLVADKCGVAPEPQSSPLRGR